jgi:hypothetical protein
MRGRKSDSISSFEFNNADIQREEVVREVLEIYSAPEIPPMYGNMGETQNKIIL